MEGSWEIVPLHASIVELLRKRGPTTGKMLFKEVKKLHKDLAWKEFGRALMRLEIRGLIHVYTTTRDRIAIELLER